MDVRDRREIFRGASNHFVRDVNPVDLTKVGGHRLKKPPRTAADFKGAPGAWIAGGEPAHLAKEAVHLLLGGVEKFFACLLAAPKGDVVVGIFGGATIPVIAHLAAYVIDFRHSVTRLLVVPTSVG